MAPPFDHRLTEKHGGTTADTMASFMFLVFYSLSRSGNSVSVGVGVFDAEVSLPCAMAIDADKEKTEV